MLQVLAVAWFVYVCRDPIANAGMRPFFIVEAAEDFRLRKNIQVIRPRTEFFETFSFPGLVEALFFALRLWMAWPSVHDQNVQLHGPSLKHRDAVLLRCPPRISIVAQDRLRKAVPAECRDEHGTHFRECFAKKRSRANGIPATVVNDVERVAAFARFKHEMPFEIRLPQFVGPRLGESFETRCFSHCARIEEIVFAKNFRYGGARRVPIHSVAFQDDRYFSPAKGRMSLANRKNFLDDGFGRGVGKAFWPTAGIPQTTTRIFAVSPLVCSFARDPELPAKLTDGFLVFCPKGKKF